MSDTTATTAPGNTQTRKGVRPVVPPWTLLALTIIAAGASLIDPLLTKGTLDLVNADATKVLGLIGVSWLAAIGIFLASIGAPIKAGHDEAEGRNATPFFVAWAALGIALFLIRWFEKVLISGYMEDFTDQYGWMRHLPMAGLIAAVYVLTGLSFRSIAYKYYTSTWHLVRPAMRGASKATKKAIAAEGLARHADAALDTNVNQLTLLYYEYKTHCTRLRNAEAEIKDRVRAALAAHLGDPKETGSMFEPHRPTNADE